MSFLNNQIVHIIANGKKCQIESEELEKLASCQEMRKEPRYPGTTKFTPQKAAQRIHTTQATEQLKRKFETVSNTKPHKGHKILFIVDIPLEINSALTGSLWRKMSQVNTSTLEGAIPRQTSDFQSPPEVELPVTLLPWTSLSIQHPQRPPT
ncbi:hypothetical protein V6N12_049525 [Hibiscus sabdariffa]|uniref:Uncharacterized protein n=1 Tax=Hibiscus sabdariffa TaxID=183260 RepID=A0ABR2CBM8_9ROSI